MNFGSDNGSLSSLVSFKHHFSRGVVNSLAATGDYDFFNRSTRKSHELFSPRQLNGIGILITTKCFGFYTMLLWLFNIALVKYTPTPSLPPP